MGIIEDAENELDRAIEAGNITHRHGKEMYVIALEHAVRYIELFGAEVTLKTLKEKIETEKKEMEKEDAGKN